LSASVTTKAAVVATRSAQTRPVTTRRSNRRRFYGQPQIGLDG
jgi:hypothetical protein